MIDKINFGHIELRFKVIEKLNLDLASEIESAFNENKAIQIAGLNYICTEIVMDTPISEEHSGSGYEFSVKLKRLKELEK